MEHAEPISIRICHLYPRLLSVAGDRGNLLALTRRCAWRGIRSTVTEAGLT
jgi:CobQ-like glutamine amidotransferase family enzyme